MTGLPVVPAPASIEALDAPPFRLTPDTVICGDAEAAAVLARLVATRTRGEVDPGTSIPAAPRAKRVETSARITLTIDPSTSSGTEDASATEAASGTGPGSDTPEAYALTVDEASIVVTGEGAAGLFYGIQTLGQLITRTRDGWTIPTVTISDTPRFAYRGVMLDVARHFHGVDTVKAYIDRAASLKFNALHLHLTDDQGWRLQLHSRPLLTEKASSTAVGGEAGGFYTQTDYREIVAYAAAHHMIVVPEIDLPGHTHAVSLAYPELCEQPVLSEHVRATAEEFGGGLPVNGTPYEGMAVGFSSLKIHDEATYSFLADVLGELAQLTPGPYLHIGGDECLGTSADDYAFFMARLTRLAAQTGKTPIAWHEAGSAPDLSPGTLGQYWGFVTPTDGMDEKSRRIVRGGGKLILSPADAIYLDMKFDADSPLGLTWANGVTTARRAYDWDPAGVIGGVEDEHILGVEAPLWSETVRTLADIDALAFPRIAAAAEAAWSPPGPASDVRTWESFAARVGALGPLWTSQGIGFSPLTEIAWAVDANTEGQS